MEHLLTPYTAVTHIGRGVALVVAAHPDDEVLGCGGAILRHVEAGDPIHVVIVTDGGHRETAESAPDAYIAQRQQESRNAAALLGYGAPTFWGLPDRGIAYGERLISRLVTTILSIEADLVYAPSPFELHPDHRTLGMVAAEAVRRCGRACRLVLYEVSAPLRPNLLLDISDLIERKRAAIACFASQLERQRYDDHILSLNRFRTYTLPKEIIAAEAYLAVTAQALQHDPLEIYLSEFQRQQRLGLSFEPAEGSALVTVIIRSVGREPLLREALDSVALQTYPNIEVLVVNAKGPGHPGLGAWCGRFPLRLVSRDRPLARSPAANVGLDEAKGDYLIFLDDDDCFDASHISSLVQTLQQHPEARVAYAGVQAMADPRDEPSSEHPLVFNSPFDPVRLRAGNYIPINAVLFARDLLSSGCRFDDELEVYEDWDFWLQLSRLTTFVHCDQISAHYRPSGLSGVSPLRPDLQLAREVRVQVLDKWRLRWSGNDVYELIAALEQQLHEALADGTEAAARIEHLQSESAALQQQVAALTEIVSSRSGQIALALRGWRERWFPSTSRQLRLLDRILRSLGWRREHASQPDLHPAIGSTPYPRPASRGPLKLGR
jgi:LmbE family N-acetylglucosaminyl deacetylase